jgi:hypothetical protein
LVVIIELIAHADEEAPDVSTKLSVFALLNDQCHGGQ